MLSIEREGLHVYPAKWTEQVRRLHFALIADLRRERHS